MNEIAHGYELAEYITPKIELSYGILSSIELIFNNLMFRILYHNNLDKNKRTKRTCVSLKNIKCLNIGRLYEITIMRIYPDISSEKNIYCW